MQVSSPNKKTKTEKKPFSMWASLVAQMIKNLPAIQDTWVQSLGREDPLGKGMAWRIPWTEEPGGPWGCKDRTLSLSKGFWLRFLSELLIFKKCIDSIHCISQLY